MQYDLDIQIAKENFGFLINGISIIRLTTLSNEMMVQQMSSSTSMTLTLERSTMLKRLKKSMAESQELSFHLMLAHM